MSPHRWPRHDRNRPESVWLAIEDIREVIDEMATQDEIAKAVATQMKRDTVLGLSFLQKAAVALTSMIVVAASVVDIVRGFH